MAAALWIVGAVFFVIYFGTWAIQIGLGLLNLAIHLIVWAVVGVVGMAALLWMLAFDRAALAAAVNQR